MRNVSKGKAQPRRDGRRLELVWRQTTPTRRAWIVSYEERRGRATYRGSLLELGRKLGKVFRVLLAEVDLFLSALFVSPRAAHRPAGNVGGAHAAGVDEASGGRLQAARDPVRLHSARE